MDDKIVENIYPHFDVEKNTTIYSIDIPPAEIVFYSNDMRLLTFGDKKIHVHRENFPNFEMDDFTREFFDIIENNWDVKFDKK